ncbi:RIB-2 protein [Aphelenchoides avenae]|nr:RIB-2 protein [Aphelenchus avenae]
MRRKGRFFLENYLVNAKVLSRSILAAVRYRLQLPGRPQPHEVARPLFDGSFIPPVSTLVTIPPFDDENLGPVEAPFGSPAYVHNWTSIGMYAHRTWNENPHQVEFAPEFLPYNFPLPSDAEFYDETNVGMRPISPGSGKEFSVALGGNRPREQFTIVMLTYNRDAVLSASLERLNGLPFLNRVIVVWNNIDRKPQAAWPRLHVPIVFVNATRNSLNNRFLPYDQIHTEAVLSTDDDIDLKNHEIVFAFRVWREQRRKIVGFPARHHARYGDNLFYNSNHTCQLSMILTGAAFLHKSYFYAYTHHMPAAIRQRVDELMNGEDLAMNFLVEHLTREPPIKTTSKWTLR